MRSCCCCFVVKESEGQEGWETLGLLTNATLEISCVTKMYLLWFKLHLFILPQQCKNLLICNLSL